MIVARSGWLQFELRVILGEERKDGMFSTIKVISIVHLMSYWISAWVDQAEGKVPAQAALHFGVTSARCRFRNKHNKPTEHQLPARSHP